MREQVEPDESQGRRDFSESTAKANETCRESLRFAQLSLSRGDLSGALLAFDITLQEARRLSLPDQQCEALVGQAQVLAAIGDGKGHCAAVYLLQMTAESQPTANPKLLQQTWERMRDQLQTDQLRLLQENAVKVLQEAVERVDQMSEREHVIYVGPPATEAKRLCGWLVVEPELTTDRIGHGISQVPPSNMLAHDLAMRFFSFALHFEPREAKRVSRADMQGPFPEMLPIQTYYQLLAEDLVRISRYGLAERACRRAIELRAEPDAGLHHLLGKIYMRMEDPNRAIRELRVACNLSPNEAVFHACLAEAMANTGAPDALQGAKEEAAIALGLDVNCGMAHLAQAVLCEREQRIPEAMHEYEQAIKLDPSLATAFTNLAILNAKSDNLGRAMELLRRALDLEPGNARSAANMGICLRNTGRTGEACRYFQTAVAIAPAFWEALGLLAETLFELKQYKESIDAYTKALEINEGYPVWHYNMGHAYNRLGDAKNAAAHWRTAVERAPEYAFLRPLIERLERSGTSESVSSTSARPRSSGLTLFQQGLLDCPRCMRTFRAQWVVCIDAVNNPELRRELAAWHSFNLARCPHCQIPSTTPAVVFYIDEPKEIWIVAFREEYPSDPRLALEEYRRKVLPSYVERVHIETVLQRAESKLEYAWGYDELWETVQVLEARRSGCDARTIRQAVRAIAESDQVDHIKSIALSVLGMPEGKTLCGRLGTIIHVAWSKRKEQTTALSALGAIRGAGMEWIPEEEASFVIEESRILSSLGREVEAIEAVLKWCTVRAHACRQVMLGPLLVALEVATGHNMAEFTEKIRHELNQIGFTAPERMGMLEEASKALDEGRPQAAEHVLTQLLREPPRDIPLHALHHMLGRCKRQQGDYAAARQHFEKAMDLLSEEWEPGMGTWYVQETMNEYRRLVAQCDIYLGDYVPAQRALDLCIAQSQALGDEAGLGRAYNQLGNLARAQSRFEDAAWFYKEAEIHSSLGGDSHGALAAGLNTAGTLFSLGKYDESETLLGGIWEEIYRHGSTETRANACELSGLLSAEQGDYAKAKVRILEALRIATESDLHHKVGQYLQHLGRLARTSRDRLERWAQAVDALIRVIEKAEREPERLSLARQLIGPASEAMNAALECNEDEKAWQFAQLMKSPVLADLLAQGAGRRESMAPRAEWRTVGEHFADVASKAARAGMGETLAQEEEFREYLHIYEDLGKSMAAAATRLGPWHAGRHPWRQVAEPVLDSKTAIVDFVLRDEDTLLFVLTTEGLRIRHSEPNFGRGDVEQDVRSLYRAASLLQRPVDPSVVTEQIWKGLIAPIEDDIRNKEQLLLVPHAAIELLPIHAARRSPNGQPGDGRFLIEEKTLSYSHSVAAAAAAARTPVPQTNAACIFTVTADAQEEELAEGSRDIVRQTGVKEQGILVGWRCTGDVFLESIQARPLKFVHVVCHGWIDPRNPARWGLSMADRTVTIAEVFSSSIDCDLVFLNSCYLGAGQIHGSGEMIGMVRSFLHAGARSVISVMWPVSGRIAQEIAKHFYQQWICGGSTKAVAIRKAVGSHIPDISTWAAFRLHGACD